LRGLRHRKVKYVALRETGTLSDDLRLVIVRDVRRSGEHAVVAVRFEAEWLLLDNRHLVLVKAEEAP
jgi:predicted transglutaminase-like cysteine proteinase